MPKSLHITMALVTFSCVSGCDLDDEGRALDIAALADEDLDPEIRAHLEAELADESDGSAAAHDAVGTLATATGGVGKTCFFCPPEPTLNPADYTPVVINPYAQNNAQNNTILFMEAAASFIVLPGATVKLQVPSSSQTFGPYALSYDVSGTQIRANVSGGFPAGSCRNVQVTNPNQHVSNLAYVCR